MSDWDVEDVPAPAAAEVEDTADDWSADAPASAAPKPAAAESAGAVDPFANTVPPPADASDDDAGGWEAPDVVMKSVEELVDGYAANAGSGAVQGPGCTNLFVGNLSWKTDEVSLRQEFEPFGAVTAVRVISDPDTGRSKGFGYVEFAKSADAAKAMAEKNGAMVSGRNIKIDFSTPRDKPARSSGGGGGLGSAARNRGSDTLFVGGIPNDANEDMLRQAFSAHGSIIHVRIPTDRETHLSRGIAYVNFSSVDEARAAFGQMNGADLGGRHIRLDYANARGSGRREGRGGRERGPEFPTNPPAAKLFIGNFSDQASEDNLREAFGAHGEITDVYIPTDQDTGASRGFAYLSFCSVGEAMAAVEALNGSDIGGRNIRLDYAQVKAAREPKPIEPPSNPPGVKLFIGGFSDTATEDDLRETCGPHGEITDLYIPTDRDTGASRGFAYLTFSSVDEAVAAVEALNGKDMAGRQLRLDYAEVKERAPREARPIEPPSHDPAVKLFIGGLSDQATEDILRETFGVHGEINDIYVPTDQETGAPKGFAYLRFSSVEEATAAVEALNGQEMAGRQLRLDYAEVKQRAPREPLAPSNSPSVKLFVGGVSDEATEDIIRETFGTHGEVTDVYVPTDAETGAPRGIAYVSFASVEQAEAVIEALNGQEMAGRQLRLDFAEAKERAPRKPREIVPSPPSNILFVGGISDDTTETILRSAFIMHGAVTSVRISTDMETGAPKGIAFVSFTSVEDAMKAAEAMNGAEIAGRQVNIDFASPDSGGDAPPRPRIPDVAQPFDPNEAVHSRAREFNTHVAAEINVPDRFELFLLQDGEKKITEQIDTRTPNSSIFTILKEDHTLCNLLRAHLLKDPAVLFAGYKIPHPLFAKVELRVQTDGSITPKEAVVSCSKKLVSDLGQFSREFTKEFELRKMVANASAAPQMQNGQL